ncbi:MAG: hypothetical protein WKF86_11550 [Acidimicrobiales bacterium]
MDLDSRDQCPLGIGRSQVLNLPPRSTVIRRASKPRKNSSTSPGSIKFAVGISAPDGLIALLQAGAVAVKPVP